MSLATRCAACGTVFRVVQDQLKVSDGWVRCGRCSEVFNALEGLFDLDRESAPDWTPSQRGALETLPGHALPSGDGGDESAVPGRTDDLDTAAIEAAVSVADTEVDTRQTDGGDGDDRDRAVQPELADGAADSVADSVAGDDVAAPTAAPEFLRQADRAARWRRPRVRLALASAAVLLGMSLATQAVVHQRDAIAAHWPQASPLLATLCQPLGCRVEPLRRLANLSVDSSGLTQLDPPALYRLQVSLRSRDVLPVMTPALDMTLTDSRGEVVARKVLAGADFVVASPASLAAGAELTLLAVLDAGDRRVTGYSVEIFYP